LVGEEVGVVVGALIGSMVGRRGSWSCGYHIDWIDGWSERKLELWLAH